LSKAKNLTEAILKFCDIDDVMATQLLEIVRQRTRDGVPLKSLALEGNVLSDSLTKDIAAALPAASSAKKKFVFASLPPILFILLSLHCIPLPVANHTHAHMMPS
jgi:hypothetical protein